MTTTDSVTSRARTLAEGLARPANDLAAVRILAAVAVLWAHAWVVTERAQFAAFTHVFAFSVDWHGVHAFFILSGMLLTRSYLTRPDVIRFTVARLVRYLPAIFVSTAIAALVIGPLATRLPLEAYFAGGAPFAFIAKVTSLADVNATLPGTLDKGAMPDTLYIPLWTIHYELVFALALGAIGALGLLGFRRLVLAGLVATLAVNVVWFWNGQGYPELGSPHHLVRFTSTFGIGVALGVFADRVPVSGRLLAFAGLLAIPLAFTPLAALAGMLLIAYAIVWIAFAGAAFAKPLAALGVWSYGFYVWGFLIEQCLANGLPTLNGWGVFLAAIPLSLAAGWASWRFVEAPALRVARPIADGLRRLAPRRPTTPAEAASDRTR